MALALPKSRSCCSPVPQKSAAHVCVCEIIIGARDGAGPYCCVGLDELVSNPVLGVDGILQGRVVQLARRHFLEHTQTQ